MQTTSSHRSQLTIGFGCIVLGVAAIACQVAPSQTEAPAANLDPGALPRQVDDDSPQLVQHVGISLPETEPTENATPPLLDAPLAAFCSGTGPWVQLGHQSRICLGNLAETTFRFGLCSCSSLTLGGALRSDSYTSSAGAYASPLDDEDRLNLGADGHIGVVGSSAIDKKIEVAGSLFSGAENGIQLGPDSEISGNFHSEGPALAAASTRARIGRNAFVRGAVPLNYQIDGTLYVPPEIILQSDLNAAEIVRTDFPPVLPCACHEVREAVDINAMIEAVALRNDNQTLEDNRALLWDAETDPDLPIESLWAASSEAAPRALTLPCGRYYLREIVQAQHMFIRIEGRVALFIQGDFRISGLTLDLADGAELDLFVQGDFAVQSAVDLSSSEHAADLRYYIQGNIDLDASSELVGNFYAPNAHFQTNGAARIFGSVLAKQVSLGAGTEIHFDSAIRERGEPCRADAPIADDGGNDSGPPAGHEGDTCAEACANETPSGGTCIPLQSDTRTPAEDGVPRACTLDTQCCAPGICVEGSCVVFSG